MTSSNIKKGIIDKWSSSFDGLSVYSQNKLYKVCGAYILGIELLNLPRKDEYRPIFVCYPLWKPELKQCLDEPIFIQEIYNKRGLQFDIPYLKNNVFFQEAVECSKEQAPLLVKMNIYLNQLLEAFDEQFSQTLIKSSPVGQAKLFEAKLLGAVYVNDVNASRQILEEINTVSKRWDGNMFNWKYLSVELWLESLMVKVTCRGDFLKQVDTNMKDKKIAKLHSYKLISK